MAAPVVVLRVGSRKGATRGMWRGAIRREGAVIFDCGHEHVRQQSALYCAEDALRAFAIAADAFTAYCPWNGAGALVLEVQA